MSDEHDDNDTLQAIRELLATQRDVRPLRDWLDGPMRLLYADSVDEQGELDLIWRFQWHPENQDDKGLPERFEYRRGTGHPDGKSAYNWLGHTPQEALRTLRALGISPDLLVKPTTMW